MGKTAAADSADPSEDPIFVVVQWSGSDGEPKFSKISLDASARSWTLAKFKAHAAAVLQVEHLQLPDFNEEGLDRIPLLLFFFKTIFDFPLNQAHDFLKVPASPTFIMAIRTWMR